MSLRTSESNALKNLHADSTMLMGCAAAAADCDQPVELATAPACSSWYCMFQVSQFTCVSSMQNWGIEGGFEAASSGFSLS